jgi:hypothetical protein
MQHLAELVTPIPTMDTFNSTKLAAVTMTTAKTEGIPTTRMNMKARNRNRTEMMVLRTRAVTRMTMAKAKIPLWWAINGKDLCTARVSNFALNPTRLRHTQSLLVTLLRWTARQIPRL